MKIGDYVYLNWQSAQKNGKVIDVRNVPMKIKKISNNIGKLIIPEHTEYLVEFSDKTCWYSKHDLKLYIPNK